MINVKQALWLIVFVQILGLSLGDGEVCRDNACVPCSQEGNSLDMLPRLSNNLGYDTLNYANDTYIQVTAEGATFDAMTVLSDAFEIEYNKGLFIYGGLCGLLVVLLLPCMFFLCCCRCCCWKTYPKPGSCTGYNQNRLKYSFSKKISVYLLMFVFIGTLIFSFYKAEVDGNNKVPNGVKGLVSSLDPMAEFVANLKSPVSSILISLISRHVVPLVVGLNTTIFDAISLDDFTTNVECIRRIPEDNIPDTQVIFALLNDTQFLIDSLPQASDIDRIGGSIQNATDGVIFEIGSMNDALVSLNNTLTVLPGKLDELENTRISLNDTLNKVTVIENSIGSEYDNMSGFFGTNWTKIVLVTGDNGLALIGTNETRNAFKDDLTQLKIDSLTVPESIGNIKNLTLFNLTDTINELNNTITFDLKPAAIALQVTIEDLPSSEDIELIVDGLKVAIGAFNFSMIYEFIDSIEYNLNTNLPDFHPLLFELNKILDITEKQVCISGVFGILDDVKTLVGFPALEEMNFDELNVTISAAIDDGLSVANETMQVIIDSNTTIIEQSNLTSIRILIRNSEIQINDTLPQLDEILATVGGANFTLPDMGQLVDDALKAIVMPNTTVMNDLDAIIEAAQELPDAVDNALALIVKWENTGVCLCESGDSDCVPYSSCSVSNKTTCGTSECTAGSSNAQCWKGDAWGTCESDADCHIDSPCPLPDLSSLNSKAINARDKADNTPQKDDLIPERDTSSIDSFDGHIKTSRDAISDLNEIDCEGKMKMLADVNGTLADLDIRTSLEEVNKIRDEVDIDAMREQVGEVDKIKDQIPFDIFDQIDDFKLFVTQDLDLIEVNLSKNNLTQKYKDDGLLSVLNFSVESLTNGAARFGQEEALRQASDMLSNYTSLFNWFESSENRLEYGGLHWFFKLGYLVREDSLGFTPVEDWEGYVDTTEKNNPRQEGSYCVTSDCLENQIDQFYVEKRLMEYELLNSLPSAIGQLRIKNSISIIFVFLLLTPVFFGVWSMLCFCSGRWNPSICVTLSSFMIALVLLPLLAVMVPSLMVVSDVCRSIPDIGTFYMTNAGESVCASLGEDNVFESGICNIRTNFTSISVNFENVVSEVLGECETDPIADIIRGMGSDSSSIIKSLKSIADEALVSSNVTLGTSLGDLWENAFTKLSLELSDETPSTLIDVLNCESIHDAIFGITDGVCCGVLNTLSAITFGLFIGSVAMVCLGMPVGICGKKKFASKLWGRAYEEDLNDETNDRNLDGASISEMGAYPIALGGTGGGVTHSGADMESGGAVGGYNLTSFEQEYDIHSAALEPFDVEDGDIEMRKQHSKLSVYE